MNDPTEPTVYLAVGLSVPRIFVEHPVRSERKGDWQLE
jgi:hypothetical protein